MSLINDALQRAKQQTTQPTPSPHLPLRPIERAEVPRKNSKLLLSITCGSVLCVGMLLGLMALKSPRLKQVFAASKPATADAAVQPAASVERPLVAQAETSQPIAAVKQIEAPSQPTNSMPMTAEAPALRPAPLKLQAILFSATKPSAMINGKTVYVGNHVGEFRVASITQTSATLISDSATNILSFQE